MPGIRVNVWIPSDDIGWVNCWIKVSVWIEPVSPFDQFKVEPEDALTVRSTLSPLQISSSDTVNSFTFRDTVTANLTLLSHPLTVWEAKTVWLSEREVEESNKLPPVAESYHLIFSPSTFKSAIVAELQNDWFLDPVGVSGLIILIEIVFLHVKPFVVTST